MNVYEMIAFIAYFVLVIGVGIYFFFKSKGNAGEKDYFLGGRDMNGLVAALSAGASDMSAWVLMGLPGAFYATGLSNMWISVGLFSMCLDIHSTETQKILDSVQRFDHYTSVFDKSFSVRQ